MCDGMMVQHGQAMKVRRAGFRSLVFMGLFSFRFGVSRPPAPCRGNAPSDSVGHHIPSNIGKLKSQPQVAGAIECVVVLRRHTHDNRHHTANCTSRMVAIA